MHLKKTIAVSLFATIALMASTSKAQVSAINVTTDASAFAGHVVNDIKINFTGQYTGAQMIVNLTSGSLYQHAAGSASAPIAGVVAAIPDLAYDTFVAQGFATTDGSAVQSTQVGGGAVNLGGAPAAAFTTSGINQGWNPAGGVTIADQTDFLSARLTLTPDANGTVLYAGFAGGVNPDNALRLDVPIINGVVGEGAVIPEPSTIVLLAMGLVGLVALKRRNG